MPVVTHKKMETFDFEEEIKRLSRERSKGKVTTYYRCRVKSTHGRNQKAQSCYGTCKVVTERDGPTTTTITNDCDMDFGDAVSLALVQSVNDGIEPKHALITYLH
jgi:hypothetical protein